MGLAAAKNKRKLGNDPNNTKWSRKTDSFGQKILRAQGWQPGQYLGAKDAPHAEWHTEANLAHIRVVLKDDNLGLGARRNNGDECTGLDAFQHLLGRLNGKSDEILESERRAREDMKLSLYVERKLGTIRFVKGGWLVGDQVKDLPDENATQFEHGCVSEGSQDFAAASKTSEPAIQKPKKRKADQSMNREDGASQRREKKRKRRKADPAAEMDIESLSEKNPRKKKPKADPDEGDAEPPSPSKPDHKREENEVEATEGSAQRSSAAVSTTCGFLGELDGSAPKDKRTKKEKEKKKRECVKKGKKENMKKGQTQSGLETETGDSIPREKKRRKDDSASASLGEEVTKSSVPTSLESGLSTPSGSGYSTPVPTGSSRYLARSKFIAQKRMALADSAALNQIFMIKL